MRPRKHRQPALRRRLTVVIACLGAFAVAASGTGFGATSGSEQVTTTLIGSLSMSDPVGLSAANPICTRTVATADTDGCADVSYSSSPERALGLGSLSGTDVQAGSLTWRVTTTNPAGYTVRMANAGAAPLLRGSAGSIPDMPGSPIGAAAAANTTGFGVAMGDAANDSEGAVNFAASPWVTGGQQGELFAGIPVGGMTVAQRSSAVASDPFTATFAASSVASAAPAAGSYTGAVSIVASAL